MPLQTIGQAASGIGRGASSMCVVADAAPTGSHGPRRIFKSARMTGRFAAYGVTKDGTDAVVANASVDLFSESDVLLGSTTSDGSGNYYFDFVGVGAVYVRAYKTGPDLVGTTLVFAPISV